MLRLPKISGSSIVVNLMLYYVMYGCYAYGGYHLFSVEFLSDVKTVGALLLYWTILS